MRKKPKKRHLTVPKSSSKEVVEEHEEQTAYHESGHAWVLYWHFLRKGLCDEISIQLEPEPESDAPTDIGHLGITRVKKLRPPFAGYWTNYAAYFAAGLVADGVCAVRLGLFTWEKWEENLRREVKEEYDDLTEWAAEDEDFSGDFSLWFRMGRAYGFPVTLDEYWQGWMEAERLVRGNWNTVEAIARALLSKRMLSASEVLALCEEEAS